MWSQEPLRDTCDWIKRWMLCEQSPEIDGRGYFWIGKCKSCGVCLLLLIRAIIQKFYEASNWTDLLINKPEFRRVIPNKVITTHCAFIKVIIVIRAKSSLNNALRKVAFGSVYFLRHWHERHHRWQNVSCHVIYVADYSCWSRGSRSWRPLWASHRC
jgi:hypothetical protein